MMNNMSLEGKVALVTGSSRGVGKAIALELARHKASLVLNGRYEEQGMELLKEIEQYDVPAIFQKADINNYQEVEQMVTNALEHFGKIDILVATGAAISGPLPNFFRNIDPREYIDFVVVHWINRLYCIKAVLEHMIDQGGGRIVNITTDAGRWPTPGESMPGGAAAGLILCTKVLAKEFARWNIFLNSLCLTVTQDTPGLDWVLTQSPASHVFRKALQRQVFPVTSQNIADVVLFLVSGKSDPMTGQIISINGGVSFSG